MSVVERRGYQYGGDTVCRWLRGGASSTVEILYVGG